MVASSTRRCKVRSRRLMVTSCRRALHEYTARLIPNSTSTIANENVNRRRMVTLWMWAAEECQPGSGRRLSYCRKLHLFAGKKHFTLFPVLGRSGAVLDQERSEERRVGKEWRWRG